MCSSDLVANILRRAKDRKIQSRTKYQLVNINKLLTALDTLFRGSLYKTKQIESTLHLDQQIPPFYCAKDKLKQIVINIIKNSVEAMAENDTIKISSPSLRFEVHSRVMTYLPDRQHAPVAH